MADGGKPAEKVKSLDGSVSEPVSDDVQTQISNHDVLPSRPKGGKDVPPPGQTLTGKQEHCMRAYLSDIYGTPNADTAQTSSVNW